MHQEVFLPQNGPIVEDQSDSLGATRETENKKKNTHIFVKSIASLLRSESKKYS